MDEEASFSALLSSSTAPSRPSWDSPAVSDDPWANPFSDTTNTPIPTFQTPFSSTILPPPQQSPPVAGTFVEEEESPYVKKLNQDAYEGIGKLPDPPSVIAAREQQQHPTYMEEPHSIYGASNFDTPTPTSVDPFNQHQNPFAPSSSDPANQPFVPPPAQQPSTTDYDQPPQAQSQTTQAKGRGLPSSLIDEDLLAESDPEQSLKKAFVKSTPAPRTANKEATSGTDSKILEKKTYVFTPSGAKKGVKEQEPQISKDEKKEEEKDTDTKNEETKAADQTQETEKSEVEETAVKPQGKFNGDEPPAQLSAPESDEKTADTSEKTSSTTQAASDTTPTKNTTFEPTVEAVDTTPTIKSPKSPTSIPLPQSNLATPTVSRVPTPLPPSNKPDNTESSSVLATPSTDRVSVSPLDPPSTANTEEDYGFKSLSIGGSALSSAPPVPEKEWGTTTSTSDSDIISPPSSRFGGKGWGVLDDDNQEDGLFGKGGPSIASARSDPWGTNDSLSGWGETSMEDALASAGPSTSRSFTTNGSSVTSPPRLNTSLSGSTSEEPTTPGEGSVSTPTTSPRRKLSSIPIFQITVSDPTKVGDPVRGYTVYTVRTQTTSPHYRKGSFSVLRRFSDFLWLLEVLTSNNPGIIIPPMPGKHTFGRFQDQFIETRRNALQRFITKITSHPVLQLDPDLRLFLESDSFAYDSKNRKQEISHMEKQQQQQQSGGGGLLGGWTGMKFVEFDDWFESRNNFLNSLENQLKNLSKSIEFSTKQKLELSTNIIEFSNSLTVLSESDLNLTLSNSLKTLSGIAEREKDIYENQAKQEVIIILNLTDEYLRFINSVRIAFNGRLKSWNTWQFNEKELTRLKLQREKLRNQGKLGDRANQSLAEIAEAERTVRESHSNFETLTRLTKSEFVRFEKERIEEFKNKLEIYLNDLIQDQKDLIELWEGFHKSLLPT